MIFIFTFIFILNTGCGTQSEIGDKTVENVEIDDTHNSSLSWKDISLKEMMRHTVSVSSEKISEINLDESDEYVQINNNIINGNFIFPYKKGYLYGCEKVGKNKTNMVFFYDNGKGKITEQRMPEQLFYICDNAIYYYESGSLKRNTNGKIETIIKFQYSEWNCLFLANHYIYYTDINEENAKTYIYRVDYQGNQKKKLYEFDTNIDQIYLYKNELWFVFHEFNNIEKSGLGRLNCSSNNVVIYEGIVPEGTSEAANKISIVNGYVYFNSSGFKRLNIQNNSVEELFHDNVEGVNFLENCILFYKDKTLYRRDSKGVKKIRKLKGKTEGFEGIRVENNKIFLQSYEGAFYKKISEINKQGEVIRNITNH